MESSRPDTVTYTFTSYYNNHVFQAYRAHTTVTCVSIIMLENYSSVFRLYPSHPVLRWSVEVWRIIWEAAEEGEVAAAAAVVAAASTEHSTHSRPWQLASAQHSVDR